MDLVGSGVQESFEYLLNYINSQEESFDGFFNFSQSTMVAATFYDIIKNCPEFKLKKGIYLPYFMVNFSPLHFQQFTYEVNGKRFTPNEYIHDLF